MSQMTIKAIMRRFSSCCLCSIHDAVPKVSTIGMVMPTMESVSSLNAPWNLTSPYNFGILNFTFIMFICYLILTT